jgi:hypothetical protein
MKFLFRLEHATSASRGLTKIVWGGFVKSNSCTRLIHLYTFDLAKTRLTRRTLDASLQIVWIYSVLVRQKREPWFAQITNDMHNESAGFDQFHVRRD